MKKAEITWETIAKLLLALLSLFVIFGIIWITRGKSLGLIDGFKNILRFGL